MVDGCESDRSKETPHTKRDTSTDHKKGDLEWPKEGKREVGDGVVPLQPARTEATVQLVKAASR